MLNDMLGNIKVCLTHHLYVADVTVNDFANSEMQNGFRPKKTNVKAVIKEGLSFSQFFFSTTILSRKR